MQNLASSINIFVLKKNCSLGYVLCSTNKCMHFLIEFSFNLSSTFLEVGIHGQKRIWYINAGNELKL